MKSPHYKVKIGIVGCGAIGSRMAKGIAQDFTKDCRVTGLYDIDMMKARNLAQKLRLNNVLMPNLKSLIQHSDCVVEAVNAPDIRPIVEQALKAKKTVLSMSVGKIFQAPELFELAKKNKCYILLPSGAVAGIDAIKAASLAKIRKITLTTRKPLVGFRKNSFLSRNGFHFNKIKKETLLFKGNVTEALTRFPLNINVAATLALACGSPKKLQIRIFTSPHYKRNSHEIEVVGDFGTITTKTDNIVCPDNPKTSYLAVLSGLQTLKQYCTGILIGT
jgi:aspartate dehydrogenase